MQFYLPMEKQIRTRVTLTKDELIVHQQSRSALIQRWRLVDDIPPGLMAKISKRLKEINMESYGFAAKEGDLGKHQTRKDKRSKHDQNEDI